MTLQELSQHFQLREQLAKDNEILKALYAAAYPGAQKIDGMPHIHGVSDKIGNLAVEIADMRARIAYLEEEIAKQEATIAVFIKNIQNDQIRIIFRLRFLRCLTWGEVAAILGGGNTEAGVKAACYRYLSDC